MINKGRVEGVLETFHREPYRKAWTREETLEYIRQESGRHFDPQVVEMFFEEVK